VCLRKKIEEKSNCFQRIFFLKVFFKEICFLPSDPKRRLLLKSHGTLPDVDGSAVSGLVGFLVLLVADLLELQLQLRGHSFGGQASDFSTQDSAK
jgi:hypothetical protein